MSDNFFSIFFVYIFAFIFGAIFFQIYWNHLSEGVKKVFRIKFGINWVAPIEPTEFRHILDFSKITSRSQEQKIRGRREKLINVKNPYGLKFHHVNHTQSVVSTNLNLMEPYS